MNFINLLILLGSVQGLILSCLLLFSKTDGRPARYFLGFFMLVLVYNGFETLNWSAGWNRACFSYYVFTLIFGAGPSLYFYVRSYTRPQSVSLPTVWKHYVPLAAQFLIRSALMLHLFWGADAPDAFKLARGHEAVSEPLSCLLTCAYVWSAWREFRRFRQKNAGDLLFSDEKALAVRWLRTFLIFMFVLCFLWVFSLVAPHFIPVPSTFSFYYPTEVLLAVLIYWIGFAGYHRIKIIQSPLPKTTATPVGALLSKPEAEPYLSALATAMHTGKLYLDPELTVGKVAAHVKASPKIVSAVLNQHLQKGFNEFVNEYRILEVKRQLLNPENRHLTISGIALECGFNSQATFQRVFKAAVGMTPKEFMASQANRVSK